MATNAPAGIIPLMRTGYAARAVTYGIIGALALAAAWTGGDAEGTTGALQQLRAQAWGVALLWVVALGLAAYALWRLTDAVLDLDAEGNDAKGIVARLGQAVTGLVHLAIGFSAARLALGNGGQSSEARTESLTSKLLALPMGALIVIAVGLVVIGAGLYYARKAYTEKYKRLMRSTPATERLDPALKAGLVAYGIVIGLIGGFLVYAGITSDPGEAGALEQAFETVRQAAFGRILLALLALGMLAFALFNAVQVLYRIVPRYAGPDVNTLAGRLGRQARARLG